MPAFNFQERFAAAVESGRKRHTIRAHRKDGRAHATIGARLTFYTGMRTKGCRKLGEGICTRTVPVFIHENHAIFIDGSHLAGAHQKDTVARLDGFACAEDMLLWFMDTHGLPFHGTLIEWSDSGHSIHKEKT